MPSLRSSAAQLIGQGDGYRHGHDPAAAARTPHGLWRGLRHDLQVSPTILVSKRRKADTPSRHPDELYLNGIQRQSFMPAIELIKDKFEVVDLDSPTGKPLRPGPVTSIHALRPQS